MNLDAELLLALGIWGFYLQDSASLLHFDDLLVSGGRRGWRVWTGSEMEMRGRFLFLPNPLLPGQTVFRASWLDPAASPADGPRSLLRFTRRLMPLRVGCNVAGCLLLVVIPWILLTTGNPVWLLGALIGCSAATLGMLLHLFSIRKKIGLETRSLAKLAIESLLCPPLAINLYRKLCLRRPFKGDPALFAARQLPVNARLELRKSIDQRIGLLLLASEGMDSNTGKLHAAQSRIGALLR